MKMLIQVVFVALVIGGLSGAGSFYWHQQNQKLNAALAALEAAKAEKPPEQEAPPPENPTSEPPEDGGDAANQDGANSNASETLPLQSALNSDMASFGPPAAVRPLYDPDGDEAGDLINALRIRASSTTRQERRMEERNEALKLIIDDLRAEQVNSAKMRKRILDETSRSLKVVEISRKATETERAKAEQKLSELRSNAEAQIQKALRERDEAVDAAETALKRAQEEQQESTNPMGGQNKPGSARDRSGSPAETVNLKKMIGIVDSLPSEDAAKVLQEMVEKGKTEAVVAILNAMNQRKSAKAISAITETKPELAADLIERLKRLKPGGGDPPNSTTK